MALLANQQMTPAGLVPTLAAAANCTADVSSGRVFLMVGNTSGSSVTVTIVTPGADSDGNAVADKTVTVLTATTASIGLLSPVLYGVAGIATVTFSATASVTCGAVQV